MAVSLKQIRSVCITSRAAISFTSKRSNCNLLLCIVIGALNGCVTPIVLGADRFGIGLYSVDDRDVNEDVQYMKIKGIGILYEGGLLKIGYSKVERVVAQLEAKSYDAITPLARITVGDEANALARQFVSQELSELNEQEKRND